MRKLLIVLAAIAVAVLVWMWVGRGGGGALVGQGGQASIGKNDPLAFAPADTPYAFGNLVAMPDAMAARWISQIDGQIPLWRKQLGMVIKALDEGDLDTDDEDGDGDDSSSRKAIAHEASGWMRALDAELAEAPTGAALMTRFGLSRSSLAAIYGIGIVPVARFTLADPGAFRTAVARLEKNSGSTLATLELQGVDAGWRFPIPETPIQAVMALVGDHLVLTVAPLDDASALRQVLGLERPARSLADSGDLQRLNKAEGFSGYGSGFVDTARLLTVFRTPATPLETAFLKQFDVEKPTLPPECDADVTLIVSSFPRMIAGYTRLDATGMETLSRIETSPDIARDLMTLSAPTPGLAAAADAQIALSFAFKAAALPALGNKYASATAKAPWTCPALVGLNEAATSARDSLNNPAFYAAGPMANSILLALDHLSVNIAEQKLEEIGGQVVIGSENAAGLIAMARNFAPQIASLDLQPGAAPQQLKLDELAAVTSEPVFVALEPNALGIGIGNDQARRLPSYLKADAKHQPLFHMAFRSEFMVKIAQLMREAAQSMPEEAREGLLLNADSIEASYGNHIEYGRFDVLLTERGLEFRQEMRMKR